ncbi:hypothetical protein GOBAR_DD09949 [Gossypium barbadense]|nr:hypothetical protein GOBAR_DD09949 [Gossypium barbadense]
MKIQFFCFLLRCLALFAGTAFDEGHGVYGGVDVARTEVRMAGESGAGGHCCGARAIFETLGDIGLAIFHLFRCWSGK